MTPRPFSIRQHVTAPALAAARVGTDAPHFAHSARRSADAAFGVGTPYDTSTSSGSVVLLIIAVGGAMISLL